MSTNQNQSREAAPAASHTPIPWEMIDDGQAWPHIHAEFVPDGAICFMDSQDPQHEGNGDRARARAVANAEFIVRSVNSHAELLAALRSIAGKADQCAINRTEDRGFWLACAEEARAAIAKATGGAS